jgi:osmotically-inducible protein OsmY
MRCAGRVLTGVAVAALCATLGCATSPPRSAEQRAADAEASARVEAALAADPLLYARHIDVRVDNGVVHLGGFVWANEDFLLARRDAAAVAGVNAVDNEMELMRGGARGR